MYFHACLRFNNALSHSKIRFLSVKFLRCQVTVEFCQIAVLFCRVPHFPAVFLHARAFCQEESQEYIKADFSLEESEQSSLSLGKGY